jgi:hypothetical protein
MQVGDYAKFYEMLLRGGLAPDGATPVLSKQSARELLYGRLSGLDRQSKMSKTFGLTGETASFNYGWAVEAKTATTPHCNHWSGYACNHGRVYCEVRTAAPEWIRFAVSHSSKLLQHHDAYVLPMCHVGRCLPAHFPAVHGL